MNKLLPILALLFFSCDEEWHGCTEPSSCSYDPNVNVHVPSSCLELDDCGVCGGSNADDLGCGCFEPGPLGCDNVCGSDLEFDECGICGGNGIAEGACDCDGNVDLGCGCGEAAAEENYDCDGKCTADLDCNGECAGTAIEDLCGECGGDNSSCFLVDIDGNQYGTVDIPFDTPPTPKKGMGIKPIYPLIAKEAGIEGTVYIQFFIDVKGNVKEAYVTKGLPNTGLDKAALDAVKESKWKPARQGEKKVGVWQTIPVKFLLRK